MKKTAPVLLALAFLMLLSGGTVQAEDAVYYSISGKVLESGTGNAISGAQVTVGTKTMVSDDAGFFKLDMPPGNYSVEIAADGYWKYTGNVSITDNLTKDFQLKKKPETGACGVIWAALTIPLVSVAVAGMRRRV